jgi:hypothetical protein
MSEDYKQVTFSDGKRKTYEKIIKEKTAEKKRELSRTLDNKADGLMKKDYPEAVDLNKALASSENMLSFALNPNTLKQIG